MLVRIFVQILDMSKTGSIVILVVLLARLLLKRAPKVFSYALWSVVLFRLLCPVSVEAPVSLVPEMTSVSQGYSLSEEPISVFGAGEAAYQAVGDALNGGLGIQHIRTTEKTGTGMPRYITTDWRSVWILFGQYVWAAGMTAMLLYSAVSYLKIHKKLSVVVPLRENIFLADDIGSPFVIGLFRPRIYLPCNLGEREQAYILLHEQHHIRRLDHVFKALAFLALTIHWFNPLVWAAFLLAGKDMEMSCDEAVIRKAGSDIRADYSASLLTLATGRRILAGTPLAFGEGDTKGRIHNLSKWKKPAVWVVLLAGIACVVLAVGLLTNPSASPDLQRIGIEDFDPSATAALWNGELIPGTTYVSNQCLYLTPISSYAAVDGDSGFRYIVGEDYFAIVSRNDSSLVSVTHPDLDTANSGPDGRIEVSKWEWQAFPYTDEEWAALYFAQDDISNISEHYEEMLYQPLTADKFLLRMDGSLWLVELYSIKQRGTYLWSIYSLVPESAVGVTQ